MNFIYHYYLLLILKRDSYIFFINYIKNNKLIFLSCCLLIVAVLFFSYRVEKLYRLKHVGIGSELKEISGIEFDKYQRLWAINDGGDGPYLYHVQRNGKIKRKILVSNGKNIDWEDMTQDDFGHFFIGDFGNNSRDRNWLTIYKIENPIDIKSNETKAEIIKFSFPKIPSPKFNTSLENVDEATREVNIEYESLEVNYDLEAFIYFKNQLYLFTKNREEPFDGKTHLFRVGGYAANFEAEYINSFTTCTTFKMSCWITSAAMSPDRTKLILLDSNRLWLFKNWHEDNFFTGDIYSIDLGIITQKESVAFFDNDLIVFTDEQFKGIGGNAYKVKLSEAKLNKVQSAQF